MRPLRSTFTEVRDFGNGQDDMAAVVLAFTR
jgi:hypothetical protein